MTATVNAPAWTSIPPKQRQCLVLMSHGLTNAAIGRRMGLSPDTVKTHLYQAFKRLEVHDRAHAVRRCFELGIFQVAS